MNSNEEKSQQKKGVPTNSYDVEGSRAQGCINAKMIYTLLQTVSLLDEMDLLNVGGFNFSKRGETFTLTKGERVIKIEKQNNKIVLISGELDSADSTKVTHALMNVCSQKTSFESRFRGKINRQNSSILSQSTKDPSSDMDSKVDELAR